MVVRLDRVDDLTEADGLEAVVGAVRAITRESMPTVGFTGARHERLVIELSDGTSTTLIVKRFSLSSSWTAYRTGDIVGREAALLQETGLMPVWSVIGNPYRAFAVQRDEVGLLMDDLSDGLLPSGDRRLSVSTEDAFLHALAALHAIFWESEAVCVPWLAPLAVRFHILSPQAGIEECGRDPHPPVFDAVRRGWDLALHMVSPALGAELTRSPADIAGDFSDLPQTLLHGDAKTANFAYRRGGMLAAFDWAVAGRGPATVDLGYYLAVDWTRHAHEKEGVIERYRLALEGALGWSLGKRTWERMVELAVRAGAGMLLWSKALAVETNLPGAAAEWDWWVSRLESRL